MEPRDEKINNNQTTEDDAQFGPLIAIVIIVLLLIIGGLYALKKAAPREIFPERSTASADPIVNSFSK